MYVNGSILIELMLRFKLLNGMRICCDKSSFTHDGLKVACAKFYPS